MTSYVFEPVRFREEHTDGTFRYGIYQSISANGGHLHLSFEEIRLARYIDHPPLAPKQKTTESFLKPNPKFSQKQLTKSCFTSASDTQSSSEELPFMPSRNRSSLTSTTSIPLTFQPASSSPPSSLPSVPPDVFILVEGEPNAYFQSIVAWRDYAHISFEEMRFAYYESQQPKSQTPCAAIKQEIEDQAIDNRQTKSRDSWKDSLTTLDYPWPLRWTFEQKAKSFAGESGVLFHMQINDGPRMYQEAELVQMKKDIEQALTSTPPVYVATELSYEQLIILEENVNQCLSKFS